MHKIEISSLKVDRWHVITSFLDYLFAGKFPYMAKTFLDNPPGPFPFYYVLALPFYFLGEIGYYSLAGLFSFLFLSYWMFEYDKKWIIPVVFLAAFPVYIYEVTVRSTLLVNSVLVMLYLYWLDTARKNKNDTYTVLCLIGLVGGLMLSTRGIMAIPFGAYLTFYFTKTRNILKTIIISFTILCGFIATLIPLYIWEPDLFLKYNPITLQASFLPTYIIVILIAIGIVVGFISPSIISLFHYLGILLFGSIGTYIIRSIIRQGWYMTTLHSGADISYFLLPIPFLLVALAAQNLEKQ